MHPDDSRERTVFPAHIADQIHNVSRDNGRAGQFARAFSNDESFVGSTFVHEREVTAPVDGDHQRVGGVFVKGPDLGAGFGPALGGPHPR